MYSGNWKKVQQQGKGLKRVSGGWMAGVYSLAILKPKMTI
jgi:hypothetical protein